jgi:hypothetical protein
MMALLFHVKSMSGKKIEIFLYLIILYKEGLKSMKNSNKKVRFNDNIIIHEYEVIEPCLQYYYAMYEECKIKYLQDNYILKFGTLNGFDLIKELKLCEQEDRDEEYLLNFGIML